MIRAITDDVQIAAASTLTYTLSLHDALPICFTLSVHNAGVSDADNVSLSDSVDSRLIVDSVTARSEERRVGKESAYPSTRNLYQLTASASKATTVNYDVASTTNSDTSVSISL